MTVAKPERLRPGELDDLVLAYMRKHKEPLTAAAIARGLGGRSAGAVANCLARLAKEKKVRRAGKGPRRYALK
jgi:hypothetical protein